MSARTAPQPPKPNSSLPTVARADGRKPQPSSFSPVVLSHLGSGRKCAQLVHFFSCLCSLHRKYNSLEAADPKWLCERWSQKNHSTKRTSHSSPLPRACLGRNKKCRTCRLHGKSLPCLELAKDHASWVLVTKHTGVWVMALDPYPRSIQVNMGASVTTYILINRKQT